MCSMHHLTILNIFQYNSSAPPLPTQLPEENRLLDELLMESKTKKRKMYKLFDHAEEKFSRPGQTVVLWSFKDFCACKAWSEPSFLLREKTRRQLDTMRRRSDNAVVFI